MRSSDVGRDDHDVIGWFVSPHGLGHAARVAAVIAAVHSIRPEIRHHVFSTVPPDFFTESLPGAGLRFSRALTDVGMVQISPLEEDVEATLVALEKLPLRAGSGFERIASEVSAAACRLVVCDISPVGLAVAQTLGLPGVLIENFTWDWIYRAYGDRRLEVFGDLLATIFDTAAMRIQAAPICRPVPSSYRVDPISRQQRQTRAETRRELGIPSDETMVLASIRALDDAVVSSILRAVPRGLTIVAPGAADRIIRDPGVVRTPVTGGPYHPDLVAASDLVIAKLGYSTVAEVFCGRARLAYLGRPRFPESPILESFVRAQIPSAPLGSDWLDDETTEQTIERLLEIPRPRGRPRDGAARAARHILDLLDRRT